MLADILHKIAGQFQEEPHDYYPRASLAGTDRCIRQMVFWAIGEEAKPLPGRTLFIFDDGNWHEELSADWIRQSAFTLHSRQMRVEIQEGTLIISGRIDGIITDMMGVDRLWEHKAINHFSFERIWTGELPVDYITQMTIYLRGLQQVNPEITEGLLLIKNKNQAQFLELLVRYQFDTVEVIEMVKSTGERKDIGERFEGITHAAFEKFALVQKHVQEKTLPSRQYERDHWRCDYCSYNEVCWAGYKEEFERLAADVELDQEAAGLCAYYLESNMHLKEMERERDALKEQIKQLLREKDVRKGKAGDYLIERKLQTRESLKKENVPADVWNELKTVSESEVLTIRRAKTTEVK